MRPVPHGEGIPIPVFISCQMSDTPQPESASEPVSPECYLMLPDPEPDMRVARVIVPVMMTISIFLHRNYSTKKS